MDENDRTAFLSPSEVYYKTRRTCLLLGTLQVLASFAGAKIGDMDEGFSVFHVSFDNAIVIEYVISAGLAFSIWHFLAAWNVQGRSVKEFAFNIIDFYITLTLCFFVLISFFVFKLTNIPQFLEANLQSSILDFALPIILAVISGIVSRIGNQTFRRFIKRTLDRLYKKEDRIVRALTNNAWILVFDSQKGKLGTKKIQFLSTGEIGEGKNHNESHWRLNNGLLEIINDANKVFSRFEYNSQKQEFSHTNDSDTLSLRNQLLTLENGPV